MAGRPSIYPGRRRATRGTTCTSPAARAAARAPPSPRASCSAGPEPTPRARFPLRRPVLDYYDVKIVIAESELYAVHEPELRKRPGDFGADFLGRSLGAALFGSVDYIQAQRQRRRILEEMPAIYARYDLLVTAGPYG